MHPAFFEAVKANFAERRPAFILDSGIRLIVDSDSRALDVTFVDIEDNIQKIEDLLSIFESRKLMNISFRDLQEMERRFSEMMSFHQYLDREGCNIQCSVFESLGGIEKKSRDILEIELRLKTLLQNQLFIPEEIYYNFSTLREHCPEILGFIIPELRGLGFLGGISPGPGSGTLEDYVMRCLQKYEALVNRDRNGFQDRNTFYRLAKQEFGPLAEEGLGVSHPQLEILEFYMDRIREKPALQQALTFALLFQEIGKLEQFSSDTGNYWTHQRQGAEILRKLALLRKYELDPAAEETAIFLVRYHGLAGHVILGDEPITALGRITERNDTQLLDAFLVHSVLASAAVREGVMVSDFLDSFINYRTVALEVIKSGSSWEDYLKELLEEKGTAVLNEFQFESNEASPVPAAQENYCGILDDDVRNTILWQGRQSAALDRLLKLAGSIWVDYEDIQMYLCEIPIKFIYHKKKFKSVGPSAFKKQLLRGIDLLHLVSSLSAEVRYYLLYCLDHLGGAMRIYDFQKLPDYFGLKDSLKLLIISLQALHHHFGITRKGGLISFASLSRKLGKRHEVLKKVLAGLPFPEQCFAGERVIFTPDQFGELRFEASTQEDAINVTYKDTVRFDFLRQSLSEIWDSDELLRVYENALGEIRSKMVASAEDLEQELLKSYRIQKNKINERVLKGFQEKLARVSNIAEFQQVRLEISSIAPKFGFNEEQQFLLEEIAEFNRFRLRDSFLDGIYQRANALNSKESLLAYWEEVKQDLFRYRSFIGKEYETLIAKFLDEKIAKLQDPRQD